MRDAATTLLTTCQRLTPGQMSIARAGALTVSELAATGTASILIPLPHAIDDHQTQNARVLANAGAAVLLLSQKRRLNASLGCW